MSGTRDNDRAALGAAPRPTTRDGWLDWAEQTGRVAMSATVRAAWGEAYDRDPPGIVRQLEAMRPAETSLTRALRTVGGRAGNVGASALGARREPRQ